MPQPYVHSSSAVWVVGLNRSGTKWISNTLCNHPDVVGIRHEVHKGILETPLLDIMPRVAGDLAVDECYERFVEVFSRSDYCRLSPLTAEDLRTLQPRPADCLAVQKLLLDRLLEQSGRKLWLQKTSPFNADSCLEHFPDARFVFIHRNMQDQLNASVKNTRDRGQGGQVLRWVFLYALGEKIRRSHRGRENCMFITYEELLRDTEAVTRRVCAHVGLTYDENMIESRYARNTSFRSPEQRRSNLGALDQLLIFGAEKLLQLLPLRFMCWLRDRIKSPKTELPQASQKLRNLDGEQVRAAH